MNDGSAKLTLTFCEAVGDTELSKGNKMKIPARRLVLGTASVLALGIGHGAPGHAADAGNTAYAVSMALAQQTPDSDFIRKDDIRWAQVELRYRGLYKGSLDGALGPETKRALDRFQRDNGLSRTASLDAQTWERLTASPEVAQGSSSMPPDNDGSGSIGNSSPASDFGR